MGKLLSREPEIEQITFVPLPDKVSPAIDAVMVGDVIAMRLAANTYATSVKVLAVRDLLPGKYSWLDDLLTGLVRLRAISAPARARHMAVCQEMFEGRQREIDRQTVDILSRRYRFEVTPAQRTAMERNTPAEMPA